MNALHNDSPAGASTSSNVCEKETYDEYSAFALFDSIIDNIHKKTSGSNQSTAIIEMDRYLAEPPLLREGDPLYWWKAHAAAYPILSKLAKASLCFVETSVPCEQIFSQTGLMISDRRTKLKPSKVRELIYLKAKIANLCKRN